MSLNVLPICELPGEISPALALPPSLEHLILPERYMGENHGFVKGFVRVVVNVKDARWLYLKNLTLQYSSPTSAMRTKNCENGLNSQQTTSQKLVLSSIALPTTKQFLMMNIGGARLVFFKDIYKTLSRVTEVVAHPKRSQSHVK